MARDLGVPQSTMWRWLNQSKQLPAEYVLKAERLYGVSRHELRPDIYPVERRRVRGAASQARGVAA
jgi:DNA-binding transcriptional regulator YdaS (Cro superfamily)